MKQRTVVFLKAGEANPDKVTIEDVTDSRVVEGAVLVTSETSAHVFPLWNVRMVSTEVVE